MERLGPDERTHMPRTSSCFPRSPLNQRFTLESRSVRHYVPGRRRSVPSWWRGRGAGRLAEVSPRFGIPLDGWITSVGAIRHGVSEQPSCRRCRLLASKRCHTNWRLSTRQCARLSPTRSRVSRAWRNLNGPPHGPSRWTQLPLEVRQLLQSCRQRPPASIARNCQSPDTSTSSCASRHTTLGLTALSNVAGGPNYFMKGKYQNEDH